MSLTLQVAPHPLLEVGAFVSRFAAPIGAAPPWLADSVAPFVSDDTVRAAVRDVLRVFGYKPTGRGKPASEYLLRGLPSINVAVDVANVVSMHAGLPISVVDLDRTDGPLRIEVPGAGASYVFNAGGQTIDVEGLPCLVDQSGPCANAVRDAQRTKTSESTRNTLSIVWGARSLGDRTTRALAWYRELLTKADVRTEDVMLTQP